MPEVIGSVFRGPGRAGDFGWMIEQPEYSDAFFVFNDNAEEFRAHQQHGPHAGLCRPGGGNAVIRPYQCRSPQRAAGIPTGSHGRGFPELDDDVRDLIDNAVAAIGQAASGYGRIYYSANGSGDLGTGIFRVGPEVRKYIVQRLQSLA